MSTTTDFISIHPVRKTITVKASADRAFRVFTEEIDSWWPRTHHIGKSPMTKALMEGRVGGRCYSEQEDGTECDWGTVMVWEPPHRFVMAWRVTPGWLYEADLAKASEVEVRFTSLSDGSTRVELEHRHFERHGAGADAMRTAIDAPGGWSGLLELYQARAERSPC
jgi:Activator of Hsp90 ATPase homolog 1-like protein